MYALGLHEHEELHQLLVQLTYVSDKDLDISMDTGFLQMLIDSGRLQEITESANCLVIYYTPKKITHIGSLVSPGRVVSKWGTAHLYDHTFYECPLEYGDQIKFYAPIEREFTVDQFFDYARVKGARLE